MRLEIANPEIWKLKFWHSEIACFVLDYLSISMRNENISQGLAASAVRSSLYQYSHRNYDLVCTKVNLKSDFHFTGQLMETYPEYSRYITQNIVILSILPYKSNKMGYKIILSIHFQSRHWQQNILEIHVKPLQKMHGR